MTDNVLGYEVNLFGTLRVVRATTGPQAVTGIEVLSSREEMGVSSQLMPLPPRVPVCYVPYAPEGGMHDAITKVTGGAHFGDTDRVVMLNTDN